MNDRWRGHAIVEVDGQWLYEDTRQPVAANPDRYCGHCGLDNTPEGYDGCLGEVAGAVNACCGHGDAGYIQWGEGAAVERVGQFDVEGIE